MSKNKNEQYFLQIATSDGNVTLDELGKCDKNGVPSIMTVLPNKSSDGIAWAKIFKASTGEVEKCAYFVENMMREEGEAVVKFNFEGSAGESSTVVKADGMEVSGIVFADEGTNSDIELLNDTVSENLTGGCCLQGIWFEPLCCCDGGYYYRAGGYMDDSAFDEMMENEI